MKNEIDVLWHRKAATWKRVETLCKQGAQRIGWDPDIVWGMIRECWRGDSADYNAHDQHFGFAINWDGQEVDIYMYGEE